MAVKNKWLGWRKSLLASLEAGSKTAETALGFVEYGVRGAGPAVLALHGNPGGYDQGLLLFRELTRRGYSVIAPSRPGYLRTPVGGGFTPAQQAGLFVALLDSLGLDKVVVGAFSAGGPCALELAIQFPERVSGLLLLSSVTKNYVPEDHYADTALGKFFDYDLGSWLILLIAEYAPSLMVKAIVDAEGSFEQLMADRLAEQILLEPEKVTYASDVIETMVPASKRRRGNDNDLYQLANLAELKLEEIRCPTLIVHGTHDKDVPSSHATYAAERIAGSELILIEEGFHLLDLSMQSDMIWDRASQFVARLNASEMKQPERECSS